MLTSILPLVFVITAAQDAPPMTRMEDLPWPTQLGVRAAAVEVGLPIVRQVVLVPDLATWLNEIQRWSPKEGRWPVLFEDDYYAPLFVRGFKPERVLRRASVGPAPENPLELIAACRDAIAHAWDEERPERVTGFLPPGVVLTAIDDPALPAGVAIAAGRGLPLVLLEGDFGGPDDVLDSPRYRELERAVRDAVASVGLPFEALGDTIDAIVLCRSLAAKARVDLPASLEIPLPPNAPVGNGEPLAVTDLLGRNADGSRYAITGWIFGSSVRSTYMAMCSLFLERTDVWFANTYGSGEPWGRYAPEAAADALRSQGFSVRVSSQEQLSEANWLRLLMGGLSADLLFMNSSGDPDWFSLAGKERARTLDVPIPNQPLALHLIHSWSLARPGDPKTIGGRLLDLGVYAYYGSVQEPLLFSFVPPASLIPRCLALGPFLVSARMLDGAMDRPWRLTAIGDPLMTILPQVQRNSRRTAPLPAIEGAFDVRAEATQAMRAFAGSGEEEDLLRAFRDLALLGEDQLMIDLWKVAKAKRKGGAASPWVLGPLFRTRGADDFLEAFQLTAEPTPLARDMLWHLFAPRVGNLEGETLILLRRNLREPDPSVDLARLLPGVDRRFGRAMSDRIVREEMEKNPPQNVQRRLGELLRR